MENLSAQRIINVLNEALKLDQIAVNKLIRECQVECNRALANHSTIQCNIRTGGDYTIGPLGLINGILGVAEDGIGYIAIDFELLCPNSHVVPQEAKFQGICPECAAPLTLGLIKEFTQIRPKKKKEVS